MGKTNSSRLFVHENAGGSANCIHKDLLPDDATVTHIVTCQGRDHIVSFQSEWTNLVIVNVHFGPELTLRRLRERLRLITPHWPHIPMLWVSSWVTLTSVNQKKEDSTYGTKPSPTVMQARLPCFIPFFRTFLRLLNLTTPGGTSQAWGPYYVKN